MLATQAATLESVGSLAAGIASVTEVTRLIAGQLNRLAEAQIETQDTVAELGDAVGELRDRVRDVADSQRLTDRALRKLAESQQHTDERLNALIATVDRLDSTPPAPIGATAIKA